MSPSDHEDENDPDGMFAFKRKKNCSYYAVSELWPKKGLTIFGTCLKTLYEA